MNNVDIATQKVRELQQLIYSPDASPNKLFVKTQEIIDYMNKASAEINTNYKKISEQLTAQLNTGRVQSD